MILLGQIISQPMQAPIQIRGMAVQTTKWLQPPVQYILHQQLTDWLLQSETRPDGASTQAIREYFTIKIILSNIGNVDRATRDLYRSTIGMLTSGATEAKPRGRECVANTSAAFGQLLGRYFVMRSFGGEPQRKQVATFIDNILSAWTERLEQNTWLDAETRTRAIEKVTRNAFRKEYAYPDANKKKC